MNGKRKILTAVALVTLLLGSVTSYGDSVSGVGPAAGASVRLEQYLSGGAEAHDALAYRLAVLKEFNEANETELKTEEPVTYGVPKTGIVCTEGTLNVRERESVLSDVVAIAYQQKEISVLGEHLVQGRLWYHVQYNGIMGYAYADYVKFGDDVVRYFTDLHELLKGTSVMPDALVVSDDTSAMDAESKKTLESSVKLINYCLKNDYPAAEANENYMNMYSILVYVLELYQRVIDLSQAFHLNATFEAAVRDMQTVGLIRENLTDTTDTSDQEFKEQIQKAVAERQAKSVYTMGEKIANYAATFIDILPYVWGGASLTKGADCSGFCGQIYAHFGYIDQASANAHAYDSLRFRGVGKAVDLANILPGDLVCYQGHVAIYYGNGMVVHEPSVGKKACFGPLYMAPILTVRRLIPE